MTRAKLVLSAAAIALTAAATTAAVTAMEHPNEKFPADRMAEIRAMMADPT
jgi:hypothetical protein